MYSINSFGFTKILKFSVLSINVLTLPNQAKHNETETGSFPVSPQVSSGCYDKLLQPGRLRQHIFLFLKVLEAEESTIKMLNDLVPSKSIHWMLIEYNELSYSLYPDRSERKQAVSSLFL